MSLRAFSYGGGVQSTAALVLAARGEIPYRTFLFAHVGERAENPPPLAYVEDVARPYAAAHGIELVVLRKLRRSGDPDDLLDRILRDERSLPFPVRMGNGAPGRRSCTSEFKIRVIARELRSRGATPEAPATVGLGITVDEIHRAKSPGVADPRNPEQVREYPLIDRGLHRRDCMALIRDEGLPMPERSACWFCPFHSLDAWRKLRRDDPDRFAAAVALERTMNERQERLGRSPVWFTRHGRPLDEVVADQLVLDVGDLDNCETGYCVT